MQEQSPYREIPPSPALAPYVRCYWHFRTPEDLVTGIRNRVLPDGCADILFNLGRPLTTDPDEVTIFRTPSPIAVGAMRSPALYHAGPGVEIIGVRFHPGGARPFFGLPLAELTDQQVHLDDIWKIPVREISERIGAAGTLRERIASIERVLIGRILSAPTPDQRRVAGAIAAIDGSGGTITIRELEHRLGLGRRRIERAFSDLVGVPPKMYCRVVRLQRTLPFIDRAEREIDWSDVVYRCGFYDQSHLIAEMKALAGLAPSALARERGALLQSAVPGDI